MHNVVQPAMRLLTRTKVGKKVSKPRIAYPIVRLSRECAYLIGERVSIYETEHRGRRALLVVQDTGVAQPGDVSARICSGERLRELELRVERLEEWTENQKSETDGASPDAATFGWACPDSNRRSSPCKGDVMTS